jgi:DNA-binding response OmpR family regulator
MNILAFDWGRSLNALVRAALRGCGHRVSTESDPAAARLKIDTALFDVLVVGPGGMPSELADYIDAEWPMLPVILAGMEAEVPPAGPVVAVLAKPLCIEQLLAALRKIERRAAADARKSYDMPVDVIAGEQRLACRVVRVARGSVMLEPSDRIAAVEGPLAICRGRIRVEGDVTFRDRGLIAVRVAPESFEKLEVGDAESHDDPSHGRSLSDL